MGAGCVHHGPCLGAVLRHFQGSGCKCVRGGVGRQQARCALCPVVGLLTHGRGYHGHAAQQGGGKAHAALGLLEGRGLGGEDGDITGGIDARQRGSVDAAQPMHGRSLRRGNCT